MADEYILDSSVVRDFIAAVQPPMRSACDAATLDNLRPLFGRLLADPNWLPEVFRKPVESGGMGGGIASWLLFRAGDGSLSLFSLVIPPGVATPVHDHLAPGLVGLYVGEQEEEVYRRRSGGGEPETTLEVVARNRLRPGDFYVLIPPEGDIHRVRTVSATPSVSIHLLGNDTGCTWRHTYSPHDGESHPFRSGWSNVPCRDEAKQTDGTGR